MYAKIQSQQYYMHQTPNASQQVYPGQSTGGQYAIGSTAVPGYNVPMEQLSAMNQTGTSMAGQQAPSDVHMYMGQPPVYSPTPGSMPPADVQSYQTPAGAPVAMSQTPGYSMPSTQSLPAAAGNQQTPYPEKALL